MSTTTKKALASSLKKKLKEKPLDKITITDLCEECGVNRQTFYYHFQDIYDLIEWIYTNEASKVIADKKSYRNWEEGYLRIFEYALEEKDFAISTYHSISREHLENFLYRETYQVLYHVIEEMSKHLSIREEDKAFIANFYKYAFVGIILDWVRRGMVENPQYIVKETAILMEGNVAQAIKRFCTK